MEQQIRELQRIFKLLDAIAKSIGCEIETGKTPFQDFIEKQAICRTEPFFKEQAIEFEKAGWNAFGEKLKTWANHCMQFGGRSVNFDKLIREIEKIKEP